jgi:hypothetical protein
MGRHAVPAGPQLRRHHPWRWELWPRLTRFRTWRGSGGACIDGTNNGCDRAIGWWIKAILRIDATAECTSFRTMRGYKRPKSMLSVSRPIAFCGHRLHTGGVDLAQRVA